MSLWNTKIIDQYFLDRECPYSKRRSIKIKSVYWTLGVLLALGLTVILFYPIEPPREPSFAKPDFEIKAQPQSSSWMADHVPMFNARTNSSMPSSFGMGGSGGSRVRSAVQVIRRGENSNDVSGKLPLGTTFTARITNSLSSTSGAQPVLAEILEDPGDNTGVLSVGARVVGAATFDEVHQRIQVHFNTAISPDGEQRSIQGLAMMPDGSSGLVADYSSPEGKREIGKFLGHFVSGLADGMKERVAGGLFGGSVEQGSIRNGILNGITQSANDRTRELSEDLSKAQGSLSLPAGQVFLIYLEKEFP